EREVVEAHRALADADHGRERDAARLVAQVRAVGGVVGAEAAEHKRVEERRLVSRAPRGVEDGLVGAAQLGQRARDPRERLLPGDRRIAIGTGGAPPGLPAPPPPPPPGGAPREARGGLEGPPLLLEPVVALRKQLGDRPPREELGREARARRLVRDGLRAVLTELGSRAAAGGGPRAA